MAHTYALPRSGRLNRQAESRRLFPAIVVVFIIAGVCSSLHAGVVRQVVASAYRAGTAVVHQLP